MQQEHTVLLGKDICIKIIWRIQINMLTLVINAETDKALIMDAGVGPKET